MTAAVEEEREHPSSVLAPSGPAHGTVRGHDLHVAAGEEPCPPCKAAKDSRRAYVQAYQRARGRALNRLAALHRSEYAQLLTDEQAKELP